MRIKFTRAPTTTKAAIAAAVFAIAYAATGSDLPSCSDAVATFNAGGCLVRQSYLHTACGWLALASLATGVVLFILKQRKASAKGQQTPPRPAWSEPPGPADQASSFCARCGTSAVAGDHFCKQCGEPVKDGTGSNPRNSPATF
jgi:hypothetical protein